MKTRIKEHDSTFFDTNKGRVVPRLYYTVQYKRMLIWRTVRRRALFGMVQVEFPSRRAAEKFRKYIEQTGRTWVWGRLP